MKTNPLTVQEAGRRGGAARARNLSEQQRHDIAMKASMAAKAVRAKRKLALQQGSDVQPV